VNHLDIAFAARAFTAGRAIRSATVRHRRLVAKPIAIVAHQLGGEQFSVAAIGWGEQVGSMQSAIPGEPRNRELFFDSIFPLAKWFNARFEAPAADRETIVRNDYKFTLARTAPQVLVTNRATAELLGRLGRRLAYLSTDGPHAVAPELVRFGRHLRFLWDHHSFPGQQIIITMTDLMNAHWATPQSSFERQALPALDAFIEPPAGQCGFEAAGRSELEPIGPMADGEAEERLMPLVERFNADRKRSTDPAIIAPLRAPIEKHYQPLLSRAWELLWRCRDRELTFPEAASVGRRGDADRDAYTRHIDWLNRVGLRRTRQSPRQAAMMFRNIEEAGRLLEAEEACDDPLKMAAYVLVDKAVRGRIVAVDPNHSEPGPKRMVRRPLVTLRSPDPCTIPAGRELWWTEQADGREYVVDRVTPHGRGSDVVLKLMTSSDVPLPTVGEGACFSVHSTSSKWLSKLPDTDPWTHVASSPLSVPLPLDESLTPES
jgi:hypothetical protein